MPTDNSSAEVEREGLRYIEQIIADMRFIYRPMSQPDRGIDGQIELKVGDSPTGQFIMVQSKAGSSYLRNEKPDSFDFYSDPNHLTYWRRCPNPVILHVYDPRSRSGFWKHVQEYLRKNPETIETPPYKIAFDRTKDVFTGTCSDAMRGLFGESFVEMENAFRTHVINKHIKLTLFSVTSDRPLSVDLEKVFITLATVKQWPELFISLNSNWKGDDVAVKKILERARSLFRGGDFLSRESEVQRLIKEKLSEAIEVVGIKQNFTTSWPKSTSLNSVLQADSSAVITGNPGAGKTTLMKYIALAFARNIAEQKLGLQENRIPLLIALRDLNVFIQNLIERKQLDALGPSILPKFLYNYFAQTAPNLGLKQEFFSEQLNSGRSIVLLDGLDEVADAGHRARIARLAADMMSLESWKSNRFLVTSRPRGYDAECKARLSSYCTEYAIRPFEDKDIEAFTRAWYQAVTVVDKGDTEEARRDALHNATTLFRAIQADPRVRELAHNPLLLSVLAMVHQRNVELPRRRARLYEECTDFLLSYWDELKDRESATELGKAGELDRDTKRALLEPIALWLHEKGEEGTEVERGELEEQLAVQFKALGETDAVAKRRASEFLHVIADRSGLLVERSTGVFAFTHLTFQEYLAARAIIDRDDWQSIIVSHLHDPWWREVVLLSGSLLSDVKRGPMTARKKTKQFLSGIRNAGSRLENILHRDLLLSVRCLGDMEEAGVDSTIRDSLAVETIALWETSSYIRQQRDVVGSVSYSCRTLHGQRFLEALVASLSSDDQRQAAAALEAFDQLGALAADPAIVDGLLSLSRNDDPSLRNRGAQALGRLRDGTFHHGAIERLVELSGDGSPEMRLSVAESLGKIDGVPLPQTALNALVKLTRDANKAVSLRAIDSLAQVAEVNQDWAVAARILESLPDAGSFRRRRLGTALGLFEREPLSRKILETLLQKTVGPNALQKLVALDALANILRRRPTEESFIAVLAWVSDENNKLRRRATTALSRGEPATITQRMFDEVWALTLSQNVRARQSSTRILGRFISGRFTQVATDGLIRLCADEHVLVRSEAIDALGRFARTPAASLVANVLVESAKEDDELEVRRTAIRQLANFDPRLADGDLVGMLIDVTRGTEGKLRKTAMRSLAVIGNRGETPRILDRLIELTHDLELCMESVRAIGKLGPAAHTLEARLRLLELADDKNDAAKSVAIRAFLKIGVDPGMIDRVFEWSNSSIAGVKVAAIQCLSSVTTIDNEQLILRLTDYWEKSLNESEFQAWGDQFETLGEFAYSQLQRMGDFYATRSSPQQMSLPPHVLRA